MAHSKSTTASRSLSRQLSSFVIKDRQYGINVLLVQEVLKPMAITPVPHSPDFVMGLINLRGQVATAIGLHQLFGLGKPVSTELMSIVCEVQGQLLALLVDEIGDVIDVEPEQYESTPSTLPSGLRAFLSGICKSSSGLISVVDLDRLATVLGIRQAS